MNVKLLKIIDEKYYRNYGDNWDDQLFRNEIIKYTQTNTVLLDVGAGAGLVKAMNFRDIAKEVHGIDPDERVLTNPNLDKAYVAYADSMPFFHDEQFDLIISDNVLEHITDAHAFFREINRVLKKGGLLLTKTPNKNHYVPVLARLTPTWFHKLYNKLRGRKEDDTFPTLYKLNTRKDQVDAAERNGFEVEEINYFEGRPEYLRIHFITYIVGLIYERLVNAFNIEGMKVILISIFRKK